ncbi:MAG: energy transducer TonB [Adhaeribacter sp.]
MKVRLFSLLALVLGLAFSAAAQTTPAAPTEAEVAAKHSPPVTDKVLPAAQHYEGGQPAMYQFIAKELMYPAMARRNRFQGQCIISFTLNEDGSTANHKVIKNIGAGCGEEALRVVKLLKFNAPGPGGSMVASIPVNFKL